jgi:hypothetical protein
MSIPGFLAWEERHGTLAEIEGLGHHRLSDEWDPERN